MLHIKWTLVGVGCRHYFVTKKGPTNIYVGTRARQPQLSWDKRSPASLSRSAEARWHFYLRYGYHQARLALPAPLHCLSPPSPIPAPPCPPALFCVPLLRPSMMLLLRLLSCFVHAAVRLVTRSSPVRERASQPVCLR